MALATMHTIADLVEALARERGDDLALTFVDHAAPNGESTERRTYAQLWGAATRLATGLAEQGFRPGDRAALLMANHPEFVEMLVASGIIGLTLVPIDPRTPPERLAFMLTKTRCSLLVAEPEALQSALAVRDAAPDLRCMAVLGNPTSDLATDVVPYSRLQAANPSSEFAARRCHADEDMQILFTSGTTGNPKGVLYSHRSTVLHSFTACAADGLAISARDSVLLVVPLFHVNAWGVPYAGAMCGAKLVLPGPHLSGENIYRLLRDERCNFSLGVPTVWLGLFDYIERHRASLDLSEIVLKRLIVGGSAAPRAMIQKFEELLGAYVIHAWGMSETSPLATIGTLLDKHRDLALPQRYDVQAKQGRAIYGVEIEIFGEDGQPLPHDGKAFGDLKARGPWVASGYYRADGDATDAAGWFPTGDVATLDADGFVQITDRSKDVIKSGGEWISSIDLENAAVGHPDVQEAAVIGVAHPRWQERPLLVIVPKAGTQPTREDILAFMADKVVKWWMPDDVVFVDTLPHTATGKLQKLKLREQFRSYQLPTDVALSGPADQARDTA